MSKHIRVKVSCEIEFDLEDLSEDVAEDIREMFCLDQFEAITDEQIIEYVSGQDLYEMNDQFGIVDADIEHVIVE
jgi:hypothetical protein